MDNQTQRNLFLKTRSDIPSLTMNNNKIKGFMHRLSMRENNPSVVSGIKTYFYNLYRKIDKSIFSFG